MNPRRRRVRRLVRRRHRAFTRDVDSFREDFRKRVHEDVLRVMRSTEKVPYNDGPAPDWWNKRVAEIMREIAAESKGTPWEIRRVGDA